MYLREMGSVELLSREGEIAIAKRIEAGREAMIGGLCESPLTFQAIIIWRDELNEGKIFFAILSTLKRPIRGLCARRRGEKEEGAEEEFVPNEPPAPAPPPVGGRDCGASRHRSRTQRERASPCAPARSGKRSKERGDGAAASSNRQENFDEDEDLENSLSLAVMEAELKPKVLETFDRIATEYKKLRKLQDQHVERRLADDALSPQQEKRSKKLRDAVIQD